MSPPNFRSTAAAALLVAAALLGTMTQAVAELRCATYRQTVGHRTHPERVCWHETAPTDWNLATFIADEPLVSSWAQRFKAWLIAMPLPQLPRVQLESPLEIGALCIGLLIFFRGLSRITRAIRQRRAERRERLALSARALTDRLHRDAIEADQLIRTYARDAYARGYDN